MIDDPIDTYRRVTWERNSLWRGSGLWSWSTRQPRNTFGSGLLISPIHRFYGYGSIPIDTFLVGWTSINPSYDLGFTRYQGFDAYPYAAVTNPIRTGTAWYSMVHPLSTYDELRCQIVKIESVQLKYNYGPLPVISTYNPIYRSYNPLYRLYNPIYNQL